MVSHAFYPFQKGYDDAFYDELYGPGLPSSEVTLTS